MQVDDHEAEEWYRRGGVLADEGGEATAEAEALLRRAVEAGHVGALVRLAELLIYQKAPEVDGAGDAAGEGEALLRRAVEAGAPGALNQLGLVYFDRDDFAGAEVYLRRAAAAGDEHAQVNLALALHRRGADVEAFRVLRAAAESGDDAAHQILAITVDTGGQLWRDIDLAYRRSLEPGHMAGFYCGLPTFWKIRLPGGFAG